MTLESVNKIRVAIQLRPASAVLYKPAESEMLSWVVTVQMLYVFPSTLAFNFFQREII